MSSLTTEPGPAGAALASPVADESATPIAGPPLHDARVVQMLTAEHASLSTARSLAYNEAFTRLDMFLGFLSMSIVALALIAQVLPVAGGLLPVAALVLTFDFVVGMATVIRILGANYDDYRALQRMSRIRNAYQQIAPVMRPYITSGYHDDDPGVMVSYGDPPTSGLAGVIYGLSTSAGMLILILSMLTAVLVLVIAAILGTSPVVGLILGGVAAFGIFGGLAFATYRQTIRRYEEIEVMFPTPAEPGTGVPPQPRGR